MGVLKQQEVEMMLRAQSRLRGKPERIRPHILVVDDDPEVGAVVGDILAGAGYSVGVAPTGPAAARAPSLGVPHSPTKPAPARRLVSVVDTVLSSVASAGPAS